MGILKSGILGPMENTTGAVVGRIHRGKNVITGLYEVSNKRKKGTKNQTASRYAFGLLNSFLNDIEGLVNQGFKKLINRNTAINAAFSYNYDHAFVKDGDTIELNYPKIKFSVGDVEGPESPEVSVEDGLLKISWFKLPQSRNCQYTDKAQILIYEPAQPSSIRFYNACERWDGEVILDLKAIKGKKVHVYISFTSANGKQQGNSTHLGVFDIV